MKTLRIVLFAICFISISSCTEEITFFYPEPEADLESNVLLRFNGNACFADETNGIMKFSLQKAELTNFSPLVEFHPESKVWFNSKQLINNEINLLDTLDYGKAYPLKICVNNITKEFDLYFTSFAIAQIVHKEDIVDEPKSLARLYINGSCATSMFDSYIGIEIRGAYTQQYEKKCYGFSLYEDRYARRSYSGEILNMRSTKSWVLDAVYHDPSKMRNRVSTEIWQDVFYENSVETNMQYEYIELFENYRYQGIYILSQKLNPDILNVSNTNTVLYKADAYYGGPKCALDTIHTPQPIDKLFWDGWTQVHPEDKADWYLFGKLRETLINGTNEEFSSKISSLIDLPAFIDYFIFMNLCGAWDNTGDNKNLYLMGKPNNQLTVIPWDLDLTFGLILWEGSFSPNSIISNNLYKRLEEINPNDYKTQLKNRWFELRNSAITAESLYTRFKNNFDVYEQNKIQKFENARWGLQQDYRGEEDFIRLWIDNRISSLDNYFSKL